MNNLHIGIALSLRDMFSGPAANASASMERMHQRAQRQAEQNMRNVRDFSFTMAAAGAVALRGIDGWIKKGSEFSYTMEYVKAITKSTNNEFESMRSEAKRLGASTIFTPQEVASGMQYMAMAGMKAREVQENIAAATYLAQSTTSQLGGKGGAADIMTNIMKGFQIESQYAGNVADVLTTAVTNANTNLFDMGEAMKYTMSTAKTLGYGVEETAAMIMLLGDAGIQGSMAGTAMENMLRYYSKVATEFRTGRQGDAMASLGLTNNDIIDARGNMLSIEGFIDRLQTKVQSAGKGTAEQLGIYQVLFGVRGARAAALAERGLDDYRNNLELLRGSAGNAADISNQMMDTVFGRHQEMISAWANFQESFTSSMEPFLKVLYRTATGLINFFSSIADIPFIGSMLSSGLVSFVAIYTILFSVSTVMSTIALMTARIRRGFSTIQSSGVLAWTSVARAADRAAAAQTRANAAGMMGMGGRAAAGKDMGMTGTPRGFWGLSMAHRNWSMSGGKYRWNKGTVIAGKSVGGQFVGGLNKGGGLSRIARFLPIVGRGLGFLGKAFSFMLGPVGMIASFLIPGLITGIADLVGATKDNTEATQPRAKNYITGMELPEGSSLVRYEAHASRRTLLNGNSLGFGGNDSEWTATRVGGGGNTTIILNVDGEEKTREIINQVQEDQNYERSFN